MGVQIVLGTGNFLGVTDLFMGRYLSTYTALEDTIIYIFPVKNSNLIFLLHDIVPLVQNKKNNFLRYHRELEDTIIYIFPVKNSNSITEILNQQKDYRGIMVYTLAKTFSLSFKNL